jgi:hypothetical protein
MLLFHESALVVWGLGAELMNFATIDVAFDVMPSPRPISQGRTTKKRTSHDDEVSNDEVRCRYWICFILCHEILWVVGTGVAVGHGWTGTLSSSVGRSRASTRSLHLSLCVVVHEARVAWEVGGRRRRHGHGDGAVVRSSGHDEGVVCVVV